MIPFSKDNVKPGLAVTYRSFSKESGYKEWTEYTGGVWATERKKTALILDTINKIIETNNANHEQQTPMLGLGSIIKHGGYFRGVDCNPAIFQCTEKYMESLEPVYEKNTRTIEERISKNPAMMVVGVYVEDEQARYDKPIRRAKDRTISLEVVNLETREKRLLGVAYFKDGALSSWEKLNEKAAKTNLRLTKDLRYAYWESMEKELGSSSLNEFSALFINFIGGLRVMS